MEPIPIYDVGSVGIITDRPDHTLPPEVWSSGLNMRFARGGATRIPGRSAVLGTPLFVPGFIFNVPTANNSFWIYADTEAVAVVDTGVHTDITNVGGAYTANNYRDWGGTLLAGVPVFNNGVDVPQYWPALNSSTPLEDLPNWPSTLRAKLVRAFGQFLVAFNLTDDGTPMPSTFRWSHEAEVGGIPDSWDYTDPTKDAGIRDLTDVHGGAILDAMLLGNALVIYKEASTHILRFVASNEIFSADALSTTSGILTQRAVASIDNGKRHIVVTEDDIIVHGGTRDFESPLEDRLLDEFFNTLNRDQEENVFVFDNPYTKEAWICYPTTGFEFPNKAIVWNYKDQSAGIVDFAGSSADLGRVEELSEETWETTSGTWDTESEPWSAQSRRQILIADPEAEEIKRTEAGFILNSSNAISRLERTGLALTGRDRRNIPKADYNRRYLFKRVWPKITGTADVYVTVGAQEQIGGSVVWNEPQLFSREVGYVDSVISGRLLAIRFESTDDLAWSLEGYNVEVQPLGTN